MMRFLSWVSWIVPPGRRWEWLSEWQAELDQLARRQRSGPARLWFLAGALPHALWERWEEWRMENLWIDLRFAFRGLRKSPGFAAVAVLTVALGVGANTSIFTLVNGIHLRPPGGISEPARLVQIGRGHADSDLFSNFSYPAYRALADEAASVEVAAYTSRSVVLGHGAGAAVVSAHLVSESYYETLGVEALVGHVPGSRSVTGYSADLAVVSHAFWQSHFGGDADLIGRVVSVNRRPFQIVGILPADFIGVQAIADPPGLFLPVTCVGALNDREPASELTSDATSWLWLFGRLRNSATAAQAQVEMQRLAPNLRQQVLPGRELAIRVVEGLGLRPDERREAGAISLIFMVLVGLVLVATCANLAGLFIARSSRRAAELSVRMAMGAGRSRLVRQLVTESTLLALGGAAVAIPLTYWMANLLPSVVPYPLSVDLAPDWRVIGFTLALGIIAGLLFGLLPAIRVCRADLVEGLREGSRTSSASSSRTRSVLVVAQLAVAMALVSGTGLMVRSIQLAETRGPGFDLSGLLVVPVNLKYGRGYTEGQGRDFFRQRLAEMKAEPGIESAAIAGAPPIAPFHTNGSVFTFPQSEQALISPDFFVTSPEYFETLGLTVVQGRLPAAEEAASAAVINEGLAERLWPSEVAVGKSLATAMFPEQPYRVAAVVADVRHRSLQQRPRPTLYLPAERHYRQSMVFHVRTIGDSERTGVRVLALLETADPNLPLGKLRPVEALASESLAQPRLIGALTAVVALMALGLGAVGLSGLISSGVARRKREMGIRMALGATPSSVLRLVLRWGLAVSAVGVATGVCAALGLGKLLRGVLVGIEPSDPAALAAGALILTIVAMVAAFLPARQATRTDPVETLRAD